MTKGQLGFLGVSKPALTAERLAKVEMLDVKARDGAPIRAYLTVPLATGPRPLIVVPHGGPELRDVFGFDLLAQALAAQGWLVLQPNFRGSGGYGRAFADAGRRDFNGKVMGDIEDAMDHVLATGRADKSRVALCGASFGGFAALLGAVRRPDAYKAIVSISGVSDYAQAVEDVRKFPNAYEYWVKTAGDPKADAAMFAAASPLKRVAEFKAPVLLMHGSLDQVVLPHQSKDMATALRRAGKQHEYVDMPNAAHGWNEDNAPIILNKTVEFLKARLS